ncbi:MAG TPA: hypothetical protein VEA79_05405 [Phenylobacterium sp.]|nr:hypothetical protein [Phenylobacterium sp.]
MKNVTISMDEGLLADVQARAGRAGLSVSRWIAQELRRNVDDRAAKAAASERIERLLETFPGLPLSENGKITIDRDEMYEHLLRRFDSPDLPAGSAGASEARDLRGVAETPARYRPADDEPSGSE